MKTEVNKLGKPLSDYRCKCGYFNTSTFIHSKLPQRCNRCHAKMS